MPQPFSARFEITKLRSSLDKLFERAFDLDAGAEVAGDVNRYLCIRVAGFLEQSLLATGRCIAESMAFSLGQSWALSWLERGPNPSRREVERFVRRFSTAWGDEIVLYLDEDQRGQRLNALVGIRNDIAHGKNQGVSAAQAYSYYEVVVEVVDWILDRFEPKAGTAPASPP